MDVADRLQAVGHLLLQEVRVVLADEVREHAFHFRRGHAFRKAHVGPAGVPHPVLALDVPPGLQQGVDGHQAVEPDVRVGGYLLQYAGHLHVHDAVPLHHAPHRIRVAEVLAGQFLREHDAAGPCQRRGLIALRQAVAVQVEDRAVHQVEPLFGEELRGAGAVVVLQRMLGHLEVEPAAIGPDQFGMVVHERGPEPEDHAAALLALPFHLDASHDPVHPVGLWNEGIVAALVAHVGGHQHEAGHAGGQAQQVDQRVEPVLEQAAQGGPEVVREHGDKG